jgi:ribA/ribD-fused uncharacterized protein
VDGTPGGLPSGNSKNTKASTSQAETESRKVGSGKTKQNGLRTTSKTEGDRRTLPARILFAETPEDAKYFANESYFPDPQKKIWRHISLSIVVAGNIHKFSQNPELKSRLLATGERRLVEAAYNDKTWGIGFSAKDAVGREEQWGKNKLGTALAEVREALRAEEDQG